MTAEMDAMAIVLDKPGDLGLRRLPIAAPGADDIVVDIAWSGISTGTEKLLYSGQMPEFPGMGYPLVPGYESVGTVARGGAGFAEGDTVFVPGAGCFGEVRGLFGGAASRLVVPAARAVRVDTALGSEAVLVTLAATAHHALFDRGALALPDLILGHGVLGRLIARIAVALGGQPVVHEIETARQSGAAGYPICRPQDDDAYAYARVLDASGAPAVLDTALARLAKGGEIVLAGFYDRLSFGFPPAFMKEARLRVAAEFTPHDIAAVTRLVSEGRLSLGGLITHRRPAADAPEAYAQAFSDPACLKMTLDWRDLR